MKTLAVIIPSLAPDERLLTLLQDLRAAESEQTVYRLVPVLIDDGSGADYADLFERARAYGGLFVRHAVNQGKGRALKTAFHTVLNELPDVCGAITADSDGQHLPKDIFRCADALIEHPEALIMGSRCFREAGVPLRSRFGNTMTSRILLALTGRYLSDTQTGLRGFSPPLMRRFLSTSGERFEFETRMLTDAVTEDIPIYEVPIETVYIEENRSSHFHPLRDSIRVYRCFSPFVWKAFAGFVCNMLVFAVAVLLTDSSMWRWIAGIAAYAVHAAVHGTFGKFRVLRRRGRFLPSAGYTLLLAVRAAVGVWLSLLFASAAADIALWAGWTVLSAAIGVWLQSLGGKINPDLH